MKVTRRKQNSESRKNVCDSYLNHSTNTTNVSAIEIDLGFMNGGYAALEQLHQTSEQKYMVTSAHLHASSCCVVKDPSFTCLHRHPEKLEAICSLLGQLPRLQQVTLDLNDVGYVSVKALTYLFQAKKLEQLHLIRLKVQAGNSEEDYEELELAMSQHTCVKNIYLHGCCHRSTRRFLGLLPNLYALERFHLRGAQLLGGGIPLNLATPTEADADDGFSMSNVLIELCRSSKFKTLILDRHHASLFSDEDIVSWATELSRPDFVTRLQHLKIVSNHLHGDISGEAIGRMLLTNTTLQTVTLHLFKGLWFTCGTTVARVLTTNSTLISLNVGIYRGLPQEVLERATEMIASLLPPPADKSDNNCRSQLQRLYLHMDFDFVLDGDLKKSKLMRTLNRVLDHNHVLSEVCFYDDCFCPFTLSRKVRAKLLRNQSGVPQLLYHRTANHHNANFDQDYAKAIISNQSNVDVVFYALSQNPAMLVQAAAAMADTTTTEDDGSLETTSPTKRTKKQHWSLLDLHHHHHSGAKKGVHARSLTSSNPIAIKTTTTTTTKSKIYQRLFSRHSTHTVTTRQTTAE